MALLDCSMMLLHFWITGSLGSLAFLQQEAGLVLGATLVLGFNRWWGLDATSAPTLACLALALVLTGFMCGRTGHSCPNSTSQLCKWPVLHAIPRPVSHVTVQCLTSVPVAAGHPSGQAWRAQQHFQALHVGCRPGLRRYCILLLLRSFCWLLGIWQWCCQQRHALYCPAPLACGSCQPAGCDSRLRQLPGLPALLCLLPLSWSPVCFVQSPLQGNARLLGQQLLKSLGLSNCSASSCHGQHVGRSRSCVSLLVQCNNGTAAEWL